MKVDVWAFKKSGFRKDLGDCFDGQRIPGELIYAENRINIHIDVKSLPKKTEFLRVEVRGIC